MQSHPNPNPYPKPHPQKSNFKPHPNLKPHVRPSNLLSLKSYSQAPSPNPNRLSGQPALGPLGPRSWSSSPPGAPGPSPVRPPYPSNQGTGKGRRSGFFLGREEGVGKGSGTEGVPPSLTPPLPGPSPVRQPWLSIAIAHHCHPITTIPTVLGRRGRGWPPYPP